MDWLVRNTLVHITAVIVVLAAGNFADEDTGGSSAGLSKYWSENYKDFEQIYGRTSDLALYGRTLPLSITHGAEVENQKKTKTKQNHDDTTASDTHQDSYEFTKYHPQIPASRKKIRTIPKSTKYGKIYTAADSSELKYSNEPDPATIELLKPFQPSRQPDLSQTDYYKEIKVPKQLDPSTIDYLKRFTSYQPNPSSLEYQTQYHNLETQQAIDFPQPSFTSFKPYEGIGHNANQNVYDSYKSIQEIIDASDNQDETIPDIKHQNLKPHEYGYIPKIKFEGKDNVIPQRTARKPIPKPIHGKSTLKKITRTHCTRCRKSPPVLRLRKVRPRVTKVKHRYVSVSD